MDPIYKKALANKTSEIMKRISNPVVLSAHLKTIFSTADLEEIEAKTSQRGATTGTQTLLSLLEKRGPKAFALFIQALLDPAINNADLADDLEQEERKLRGIADSLVKDIPFALRTKIERMLNINTINDWRGLAAAMKLSIDDVDKVEEGENGKITGLFDKMILTKTTITDLLDFLRHPAVQRLDVIDEIVESYIFDLPKALSENESSELDKTADTAVMLPSYVNNRQVSDSLLLELVENLSTSWKMLGRRLDISNVALVNIDMEHDRVVEKAMAMFAEWKRRKGEGATVGVLRDALERTGRRDLSERVRVTSDPIVTVTQLQEISDDVGNCWSEVVPLLCIPELFISPVQKKYRMNKDRAMAILVKWKQREGHNATVGRLADVFEKVGRKDIAEILLREPRETPKIEAKNRDSDDEERDCGKLIGYSERGRSVRQETNKDISKEPSTSGGHGDSRGDLGSAVSGYSSFLSKEVTSLHPESCPKAEDVLQLDKLRIVSEPSLKSAHEGESVEVPEDDTSKDPGPKASGVRADIRATTMMFEAEHEECIRVLPYEKDGQFVVQFYVYSGESGIPKDLEGEAQQLFEDLNVRLEWSDLYNNSVNVLKVQRLEYSFGKPKTLTASQVDEMNDVIEKNLPELSKHRNITSVQASFKITNSTQIDKPCITIYVLGKGLIPFGESVFPNSLGGYPVDVVNGFWRRAGRFIDTSEGLIEGQEQNDVLKLGASIGVQGEEASGTLGAIVKSGGTYYALSCDHVMRSEETSIVHPGLYDHLKYLRYFLGEYKGCVDDVTGSETQCSVETLSSSQQLINKFEELKSIKEKNAISSRCTRANLKKIERTERAFEEGREPPRKIGQYVIGVSCNKKWTDDHEYFVDAAIAKLSDEEVEKLKESRSVRMFGTYIKPGSECCSAKNQAILEAEKLCKSGRTTGYTEIGDKIIGSLQAPHFMVPPCYELKAPFVTVSASRYSCENCGGSGTAVTESEAPLCCDKCRQIEQTTCEKLWFRRCLCIQQETAKRFAGDGDSGSVIFQMIEKFTPLGEKNVTLKGLGLLFGMLEHQYHRFIMASPLQVVLEALSKDLPDGSDLKLVSEF